MTLSMAPCFTVSPNPQCTTKGHFTGSSLTSSFFFFTLTDWLTSIHIPLYILRYHRLPHLIDRISYSLFRPLLYHHALRLSVVHFEGSGFLNSDDHGLSVIGFLHPNLVSGPQRLLIKYSDNKQTGKWLSGIRTSSVAVHCDSCCCQGWETVSERAKGDLEVNASMTEGKLDVWKLQQTKPNVSRLP